MEQQLEKQAIVGKDKERKLLQLNEEVILFRPILTEQYNATIHAFDI